MPLNAVEDVNKAKPHKPIEIAKKLVGNLRDKQVAVLGLSFKPNTHDMRKAVFIKIINKLLEEGITVTAYDPAAIECLKNADCCIIVTEWQEFKKLKPEDFTQNMKQPS